MTEYEVFDRHKEEGQVFLQHRVELKYSGTTPQKHLVKWLNQGYGGDVIDSMDEDPPGVAMGGGGEEADFDEEIYIVERYGSEVPENMSVNYALKQMQHIGNSIEDDFVGASVIDVYSTFYCDRPVLPPEDFFRVVEDPADELRFQEL